MCSAIISANMNCHWYGFLFLCNRNEILLCSKAVITDLDVGKKHSL